VQHWKEWTHAFWVWAFGWLGIHLAPDWAPVLSFLLFGSLLTIGQAVKFNNTIKNQPTKDKYQGKSFKLISWRTLLSVLCMVVVMILLVLWGPDVSDLYLSTGTMAFMISPVVLFARHRLYTAISAGLMLTFFMIITSVPLRDLASQPEYIAPSENDVDVIVLV